MARKHRALLCVLALTVASVALCYGKATSDESFPRTVTEADGMAILIPARPRRIVSTTLGSDHILLSLLPTQRILALTHFATNPAYSFALQKASTFPPEKLVVGVSGSAERILTWRPDLVVIALYSDLATVAHLRDAGIPVVVLHHLRSLEDIRQNILLLGSAVGEEGKALKLLEEMDRRLESVARKVEGMPRVRAMTYALIGGRAVTEGAGTSFEAIINAAGGENVAATEGELVGSVTLSMEKFLSLDPDVIVMPGAGGRSPHLEDLLSRPGSEGLRAVRSRRIVVVQDRYFYTVSHHIAESIELFARLLHPEAFGPGEGS